MTYQPVASTPYLERTMRGRTGERSLWERILGLLEQDLAERRDEKRFVEVQGESGSSYEKEIGELSASERRSLRSSKRTSPNGSWSGT